MSDQAANVTVELSRPAAVFLRGMVEHMNKLKILPPDDVQALETSGWLEEIEAKTRAALDA